MAKKKKPKYYGTGVAVLALLALLAAAAFLLPIFSAERTFLPIGILLGRERLGLAVRLGIAVIALSILMMLFALFLPHDRIGKYMAVLFLSLILCAGYAASLFLLSSAVPGGHAGIGLYAGLAAAVLLFAASLYFNIKDPIRTAHKAEVWYGGLNKIMLLISFPLSAAVLVVCVMMWDLLLGFSALELFALACFVLGTLGTAVTAARVLYVRCGAGIWYYAVGVCFVAAALCISTGEQTILTGLLLAAVNAVFWLSLGNVARKYFSK